MKKVLIGVLLLKGTVFAQSSNIHYVNPFIGTTKSSVLTRWGGNGGTYPGAAAPSGAIQISPETRMTGAKGYDYTDPAVYFFSCIKHYSGFPEGSSGHLWIMPVTGDQQIEPGKYNRPFSHDNEKARPGYYKVTFKDNQTIVETSAATRTGMIRFTFAANVRPQVFVADAGVITVPGKRVVQGTMSNIVINFSEDYLEKTVVKGGYLFTFTRSPSVKTITFKLSTSTVDVAAAQNNIRQEIGSLNFDQLLKKTSDDWSSKLSTIDITDPDISSKTVFYAALYHSLLIPWVVSDVDGRYRGEDGVVHQTHGKNEYGGFSPWDTFRSLHPLLSLLYPEKQNDIILSMLDIYQQTGHLPTESMTGNHAVPIIVDAYLKGVTGFDKTLAYEAMKKNIVDPPFVQSDMVIYHQLGYIPFSHSESVTRTVEYAYDDWALSRYAKLVMNNDKDYDLLEQRGFNYRNLFHAEDLFMLPRKDQVFKRNPGMSGYKEGDKWVYSYFVPQNGKDLVNLMGGNEEFSARLDSALNHQVILYDNETVIHLPYLFSLAGHPELTQKWVREIMTRRFAANPGGLPGNDDLGAMSSAYLFNAMGIFPLSPGRPEYVLGSPLFQSVKLHLAKDKTFVINRRSSSAGDQYVQSLTVNHHPYGQLMIPHGVLAGGGEMEYVMGKEASKNRLEDPLSLSETKESTAIEVLSSSVSKLKVEPDEQFSVHFSLINKGSSGTRKMSVYVNGKEVFYKHVLVPPGTVLNDSISCRLYPLGKVTIGLKPDSQTMIEVVAPAHPAENPFMVSGLKFDPVVSLNQQQQVSYTVKSLSGTAQSYRIPVSLDDSVLYTDLVRLSPGENKTVSHHFNAGKAGIKTLKAGAVQAKYKVYDTPVSSLLLDLSMKEKDITDRSGFENNGQVIGKNKDLGRILLGDSCFVEVPNAVSLDQMEESITMMAWVYPEGKETGLVDMLSKGDSHVLQMMGNKTLTFFAGGWGRGDCTVELPADWKKQWHHIAGVAKGDVLYLYIDGKLSGTSKVEGAVNLSVGNRWQIGRNEEFPSERIFHGYMEQVKIYEQALSEAEISAIVNREKEVL
jgi:putative alpha-1,2-mannosidase